MNSLELEHQSLNTEFDKVQVELDKIALKINKLEYEQTQLEQAIEQARETNSPQDDLIKSVNAKKEEIKYQEKIQDLLREERSILIKEKNFLTKMLLITLRSNQPTTSVMQLKTPSPPEPVTAILLDLENKEHKVSGVMTHEQVEKIVGCSFAFIQEFANSKWKKSETVDPNKYGFVPGMKYRICEGNSQEKKEVKKEQLTTSRSRFEFLIACMALAGSFLLYFANTSSIF